MLEILERIIPIILLCCLGILLRYKKTFSEESIHNIKKLVINIALPAVLFKTFLVMEINREDVFLSIAIIILLLLFFIAGRSLNKISWLAHTLNPYLSTSFAYGLLGIPLFSIVFGEENLGVISIFGLGHELFVWLFYYTVLRLELTNKKINPLVWMGFFKSPIGISILLGVIINLLGLNSHFYTNHLLIGLCNTLTYIGSMATPLILITIGYGLKLKKSYLLLSLRFVVIRLVIVFDIGYLYKLLIINRIVILTPIFNYAYYTFLLLPPLFSLPIFLSKKEGTIKDSTKESGPSMEVLANHTIVLCTLISLIGFILLAVDYSFRA